jgi:SAM-dependent methyltransferase
MYQRTAGFYNCVIDPLLAPAKRPAPGRLQGTRIPKILDLRSGTGTQCVLLYAQGFEVFGVDESPERLSVVKRKSPPWVRYYLEKATSSRFPRCVFRRRDHPVYLKWTQLKQL